MRKIYALILGMFASATFSAQLTYTVNDGVFKMTYGKSGDWSFYDPQGAASFWVHTWSFKDDGQNTEGKFEDAWSDSNVVMTWSAAENAYVGTIDLNTKMFTASNNKMSLGTIVQEVGTVFKNKQNGADFQSGNKTLIGPTTIKSLAVSGASSKSKSIIASGKLFTSLMGNLDLTIYDLSGKIIKTLRAKADGSPIDLNLLNKGLYIINISGTSVSEVIKFNF